MSVPPPTVGGMDSAVGDLGRLLQPDPYARGLPKFLTVVDSDALLSSIDNHCRTNRPSRIARLARSDRVEVLAPDHVYGEVYDGFRKIAKSSPCTVEQLRSLFEEGYLPYIRWVKEDSAGFEGDDRIQAVLDIDDTDVPTAQLASLIGPCLVLSGDKSLTTPGFAPNQWRSAAGSAITMVTAEASSEGAAGAVGMPVVGVVAGTVKLGNRFGVPWFLSVALLGGSIALLLEDPTRRSRVWSKIGPFVEAMLDYTAEENRKAQAGRAGLAQAMCKPADALAPKQMVTIVLARASEPILAREVQTRALESSHGGGLGARHTCLERSRYRSRPCGSRIRTPRPRRANHTVPPLTPQWLPIRVKDQPRW